MTQRARALRREATASEVLLWRALRDRRFLGAKWRRQQPMAGFVVDFFCAELRVVIEVDGPIHRFRCARDRERQRKLEASGLRVIRVQSKEVEKDLPNVLAKLAERLRASPSSPSPPVGEGELRGPSRGRGGEGTG